VPLRFPTETAGEFKLEAAIEPMEEETDPTNNSASRQLRIVDEKIKVLFVEELPRWDYKYLQAVLMRDRRVEVKTLLLNSDPKLAQQDDTPYIDKFPENKKDLFEYDVIVFGDVDPGKLRQLNWEPSYSMMLQKIRLSYKGLDLNCKITKLELKLI